MKSNLGLLSTSLALVLEPVTLAGADRIETVRLVEQGGSRFTGSELLGEQGQGPSKLEWATSLLASELAEGPKRGAQLQAKASEFGISLTTLERAKAKLDITSDKLGLGEGWSWALPEAESVGLASA